MIWFTADTHFGHANIIKYCHRPFLNSLDQSELNRRGGKWHEGDWADARWRISKESVELMDDVLLTSINSCVESNDELWILGDFCFGPKEKKKFFETTWNYRQRIRCENVHIVWGNHDRPSVQMSAFHHTYNLHELRTRGYPSIVLCHYAMAIWNKSHRGNLHLYGHSHSQAEPWLNEYMPNRRSMDVGVDNVAKLTGKYRPVSIDEVVDFLGDKRGESFDHHIPTFSTKPIE